MIHFGGGELQQGLTINTFCKKGEIEKVKSEIDEADENNQVDKETSYKPLYFALALVVVLWLVNLLALKLGIDRRGIFGDMFGAVNALFSGLAFAGIIFTIFL